MKLIANPSRRRYRFLLANEVGPPRPQIESVTAVTVLEPERNQEKGEAGEGRVPLLVIVVKDPVIGEIGNEDQARLHLRIEAMIAEGEDVESAGEEQDHLLEGKVIALHIAEESPEKEVEEVRIRDHRFQGPEREA